MSNKFQTTLQNLPNIAKYLLVLLVIVFISLLSPSQVGTKYQYEEGEPWSYNDLVATESFPIQKNNAELEAAYLELERKTSPFYKVKEKISTQQKKRFKTIFGERLIFAKSEGQYVDVLKNPNNYLRYAYRLIGNIYDKGIIDLVGEHEGKNDLVIQVFNNNNIYKKSITDIPNLNMVESSINDSLFNSGLNEADFLIPLFQNFFSPNLVYNDSLTQSYLEEQKIRVALSGGMVDAGEMIVTNGEIISDETFQKIKSYQGLSENNDINKWGSVWQFLGYFILSFLIVGIFLLYLQFNARHIFERFPRLVFVLLWLVVYSYLVYLVGTNDNLSPYLIPFCIVPIVIKNFYDERIALFTHVVVILIASYLSALGYEFIFIQMVAGIVAVLAYDDTRDWSKFFLTIFYIFIAFGVSYFGLSLIKDGGFANLDWTRCEWFVLSTFFTLLAYPLIPLLERLFGFTSSITLLELSDMNRPLLKELAVKAPGTLQHSIQVANLSEAAAIEIGANAHLMKAAALYHDIGKMVKPNFYIENQKSNSNPHDQLDQMESAKIIIDHVEEGVNLAKKYRLPNVIIDFIKTHHGTTRVEYFYRTYKKNNPDKKVDVKSFCYSGPIPRTKEETILMLADSLEAASKSLNNPTGKDIDNLVDNIVVGKISLGQLENSAMSFAELESCILVFKKILRSINHVRVEYPESE